MAENRAPVPRLVLVTGGGGFIGRHLVRLLLDRGFAVRVLDLSPPADIAGVDSQTGSILDRAAVRAAVAGAGWVFHLAANPNLWARNPDTFRLTNLEGTRVVLDEARRAGVARTVYTSTESILKSYRRNRQPRELIDEDVELSLADMPGPYCRSKFLAEAEARRAAAAGQPVVIVNPTLPIGPGDERLTPPTAMLLAFLRGRTPAYLDCVLNLIDVRDVALGHLLAAERGRIGERYILGHENVRLGELLARLQRISGRRMPRRRIPYALAWATALVAEGMAMVSGKAPLASLTGVRLARTPMAFDARKAARELGLAPRPIDQSLRDTVNWLQDSGRLAAAVAAAAGP